MSLSVTHKFVSAKADSTDLTLINPSNWNDGHTVVDNGNDYLITDFDFTLIRPPENLSPSLRTFTLATVPLGVNGIDTNHYLGIFNNAGVLQEIVLINGGSAVGGATTGTISVSSIAGTYATNAYKIGSASKGFQETLIHGSGGTAGSGVASAVVPASSNIQLSSTVVLPANGRVSVRGRGMGISNFFGAGTSQDILNVLGGNQGFMDLQDFTISNVTNAYGTAGSSLKLTNRNQTNIKSVELRYAFTGLTLQNCVDMVFVENVRINTKKYGIYLTGGGQNMLNLSNFNITGQASGIQIDNTTTTGCYISNGLLDASFGSTPGICLNIIEGNGFSTNEIQVTNVDFETNNGTNFQAQGNGSFSNNSMLISNCRLNAAVNNVSILNIQGIYVRDCCFVLSGGSAAYSIRVDGCKFCTFENINIINPVVGYAIQLANLHGNNCDTIKLSGIVFTNQSVSAPTGGIDISSSNNVQIENCDFSFIVAGGGTPITIGASVTNLSLSGFNPGVTDVWANIADAATLALPIYPNFKLTGSGTAVTDFGGVVASMRAGTEWTFVPTAGNITFTAGNKVGNTITINQNTVGKMSWDGTKVWIK